MFDFRVLNHALVATALIATGSTQNATAQTYPSQNVTILVAFPAGGLADIIGRLVSTKLTDRLKQNVVVENRGGAGGNLAAKVVAVLTDGYAAGGSLALAVNATASK
jgi:tripartite-type tricarboxylate transporter receptor subunit TctC